MIISEKQIMQLMAISSDYVTKIELMIEKHIATGDAINTVKTINNLLMVIRGQQSDELKVVE